MPTIVLGSFTFQRLLDWDEVKTRLIPRKPLIGSANSPETAASIGKPKSLTFTARVTPAEKTSLRTLQEQYEWQQLTEDAALIDYFWIEEVEFRFRQVESVDKPWLATVTIIASTT